MLFKIASTVFVVSLVIAGVTAVMADRIGYRKSMPQKVIIAIIKLCYVVILLSIVSGTIFLIWGI